MEPEQLRKIVSEVQSGLKNEREQISRAQELADFLAGEGQTILKARPGEDPLDYAERPKRTVELVRRVVDLLATQYAQPPTRRLGVGRPSATVDEWLQAQYEAAHVNAKLCEADRLSTNADLCMVQVYPAGGDPADAPIDVHIWARDEFAFWTVPGDPTALAAVVTVDREDEQSRLTLWTDELEIVFVTEKIQPGQTMGGRTARLESQRAHGLGTLPFVPIGYELATRSLRMVRGVGHVVKRHNESINEELSDLANAVRFYGVPMLIGANLAPEQRIVHRPGSVTQLRGQFSATGNGPGPELSYLTSDLMIEDLWNSIRSSIGQALQDVGIPASAYRMEQIEASSGIALLVEQAPLLKRLETRRTLWAAHESAIAVLCLTVAGTYYGRQDLRAAAADPGLDLWWPEPRVPIPDETLVRIEAGELADGLLSRTLILMRRHGWTREQAKKHLETVAEDLAFEAQLAASYTPQLDEANPDGTMRLQEGQGQGQGRQKGPLSDDDDTDDDEPGDAAGTGKGK